MNQESKILIWAVIIIIIAIFSFNSGITGFAVKDSSSIAVSPEAVSAGDKVIITIFPSQDGVNNKVSFYNAEDDLRKASIELCNGSFKCEKESSVSYWIPDSWNAGVYYVKVYDYNRKGFIIEDFTIR